MDLFRRLLVGGFTAVFGAILIWIFLTIYTQGSIKLIEPNIPILTAEIFMSACLIIGGALSIVRTIQLYRGDK